MSVWLVIDGNSLANRCYFGVSRLTTPEGKPANAVFGFMSVLKRIVDRFKPDYVVGAFDAHAKTFRHEKYDEYKAGRSPMPDDLREQMPIIKNGLSAMNALVLEIPGYEADDILGTVSNNRADDMVYLVTGDRDCFQLISDNTKVCFLCGKKAGADGYLLYSKEHFELEYGFEPVKIVDLKALMGDSSDNIPGIKGIGEKTAMQLIQKYGNLENILSNPNALECTTAVKKKLVEGKESALFSYWLATIKRDVPIELENVAMFNVCSNAVMELFIKLGFRKFLREWHFSEGEELQTLPEEGENFSLF